jgi:hypothetical protein
MMIQVVVSDETMKKHIEAFYTIERQITGLHTTSSVLKMRAKGLSESGEVDSANVVKFQADVLIEIANNIKENLSILAESENKMFEEVNDQLRKVRTYVIH